MTKRNPSKAYLRERTEKFEKSANILFEALIDIIKNSSDNCFKCHMIAKLKCGHSNEDIQERICELISRLNLDKSETENEKDQYIDFTVLEENSSKIDEYTSDKEGDDFEDLESFQTRRDSNENLLNIEANYFHNSDSFESLANKAFSLEKENLNEFDLLSQFKKVI
jgi:hypothetical protein